jgi:NAD(P)-dependent dehydrogenase (short-subunit alcohol dehydrogenase family)
VEKMKKGKTRVALITGGSGGIGSTLCKELAKKKIIICFTYFNKIKEAKKIANEINLLGGKCYFRKMDIKNFNSVKKIFNYFKKKCKNIDILINNSGISQVKNFQKLTSSDWNEMINTNLKGPFFLTKYFLSKIKENNWCRIINISSISGVMGGKHQVHYAISKAGIISMTKSLNNLYGKINFTINTIAPGLVRTPMIKKELKLIKKNKVKIVETKKISKIVLSILSDKKKTTSGKIFFV